MHLIPAKGITVQAFEYTSKGKKRIYYLFMAYIRKGRGGSLA